MHFPRHKIIIILSFLVFVLGLAWLYFRLDELPADPPPDQVIEGRYGSLSSDQNILITAPLIDIPRQIYVYNASQVSELDFAQQVANAVGITNRTSDNRWVDADGRHVSYASQFGLINYNASQIDPSQLPMGINTSQAERIAIEFFNLIGIDNIIIHREETSFIGTDIESFGYSARERDARAVSFTYSYTVDGFPLRIGDQPQRRSTIRVSSVNQVVRASMMAPVILGSEPVKQITPLTFHKISEKVTKGEGILLQASSRTSPIIYEATDLNRIMLEKAKLEYRYKPESGIVYPYINYSGLANTIRETNIYVEITIPVTGVNPQP